MLRRDIVPISRLGVGDCFCFPAKSLADAERSQWTVGAIRGEVYTVKLHRRSEALSFMKASSLTILGSHLVRQVTRAPS